MTEAARPRAEQTGSTRSGGTLRRAPVTHTDGKGTQAYVAALKRLGADEEMLQAARPRTAKRGATQPRTA